MSVQLIRIQTLLRGSRLGFSLAFVLQAAIAGLLLANAGRPFLLSGTLALMVTAGFIAMVLSGLIGSLLLRMPGPAMLRPHQGPWLRQLAGGLLAWQLLIAGLPLARVLWPIDTLLSLVAAAALPLALAWLPLAWQVLMPPGSWAWLMATAGLLVASSQLWFTQQASAAATGVASSAPGWVALGLGLPAALGAAALLPRVITRLCSPVIASADWYAKGAAMPGIDGRPAKQPKPRSLQPLLLPVARPFGRFSHLGLRSPWLQSAALVLVFCFVWFSNIGKSGPLPAIGFIWIVGAALGRWNQSLWLSPRTLLLPGGLHRRQLLPGLIRQALRDHALTLGLLPYLQAMLAALLAGFPLLDGLLLAVPATAASLVALAVALCCGGRGWRFGTLLLVNLSATLFAAACQMVAAPVLLAYFSATGTHRAPVDAQLAGLAASTLALGGTLLMLSMVLNARRWRRMDWQRMPPLPSFAHPSHML